MNFTRRPLIWAAALVLVGVIALLFVVYFSIPPRSFSQKIVSIPKTMYLSQAADLLKTNGVIKSASLFKLYTVLLSGHRQIKAGDYLFDEPQSALRVSYRMINGIQGLPKVKVTFYEGMTSKDMAAVIKKNFPKFNDVEFLALAKPLEGKLFPDTYFLYGTESPKEVVDLLSTTFKQKMNPYMDDIERFGKSLDEVLAMASIVEMEATSSLDRRLISGVLWKRISIKMPLQVDPPFYYLLGKTSAQLTMKDLQMDSPYNLYKNIGLPPTPINNPGLSAILDTINPTMSKNLFFLADKKGNIHYAPTLELHVANKYKYLD